MKKTTLVVGVLSLTALPAYAEIMVSGFGSVVGAQVVDGSGYIADYPNLGRYDDDLDFTQESRFGVQATYIIDDKLSATAQAMARGANEFDPEVTWFFIRYSVTDNSDVQMGQLRMPVYYFSEYMDVGYAYPWIRVPADTYSLDVTEFNGIKYNLLTYAGDFNAKFSLYYGRQDNQDSELMSYLFDGDVDREFRNIAGIAMEISWHDFSARGTYTQANLTDLLNGVGDKIDIKFYDLYVQQAFGPITIMAEYNKYDPFYESYFGTATYRHNDNTFYVLWSKFDLDLPFEEHDTAAIGVRHELNDNAALKLDVSKFNDDGYNPFTSQPNPVYHEAENLDGDAVVVSIGVDFIF